MNPLRLWSAQTYRTDLSLPGSPAVDAMLLNRMPTYVIRVQVEPASECKLKWTDPDEAGLLKFLVEVKG